MMLKIQANIFYFLLNWFMNGTASVLSHFIIKNCNIIFGRE